MKTMMTTLILTLTSLLMISCDYKKPKLLDSAASTEDTTSSVVLQTLDTSITLSNLAKSNYKGHNLTDKIAKKILYTHFTSKGYFTADNLPDFEKLSETDQEKLSVDYKKIYLTELNGTKNEDAVITYWLTPPYANGHCWQPHKAIILDADKGYTITNEEFIPDNFAVDSVVTSGQNVIIYGYDYNCGKHEVLKNFRIKIK